MQSGDELAAKTEILKNWKRKFCNEDSTVGSEDMSASHRAHSAEMSTSLQIARGGFNNLLLQLTKGRF